MGLFGKKKKTEESTGSVPETVPEPPRFPEIGEIKNAIKPAPFSNEITAELPKFGELKPLKPISLTPIQFPEKIELDERVTREMPSFPKVVREMDREQEVESVRPSISKLKEPIFVKIDKFEEALTNFEEIKKRLQDSFELLEKIRRIRGKEEEEIKAWEVEIEEMKQKLENLDKKLFSRVEL